MSAIVVAENGRQLMHKLQTMKTSVESGFIDPSEQYATFWLGHDFFGVEVLKVQEILKSQEMTPLPLAPHYVSGLINLRGQIITAIDLGARIANRKRVAPDKSMNVVINSGGSAISLLVDKIGDVITVELSRMVEPPPTLKSIKTDFLKTVGRLDSGLLMILNVDHILQDEKN